MTAPMIYIHVEEPSMEDALRILLPKLAGNQTNHCKIIQHSSKHKLLTDLPNRFAGYAARLPRENIRALVVVDRDDDDCRELKNTLEQIAIGAGFATKASPDEQGTFRVVTRLAIEELEAWFLGDVPALCAAYPGLPHSLGSRAKFRNPDGVAGGTWEALLRELQKVGYYKGAPRLPKMEVARKVASYMVPERNRSPSFQKFCGGLTALLA